MKKINTIALLAFIAAGEGCASENPEFIREAISVAQSSRDHGSHPFGALLVCDGKVFLKAENHVEQTADPMRHAEMELLESFVNYRKLSETERHAIAPQFEGRIPDIKLCQMYASTEPCQMCEGAIYTMKVGANLTDKPQVIFGLDKGGLSQVVRGHRSHDRGVITDGPHLLDEARLPHEGFWRKQDND